MDTTPRWIPLFFGAMMFLMGALILGALLGMVPTDGGEFLAPPLIIAALGLCLVLAGISLWIPTGWPVFIRTFFLVTALAAMATVCNWTAFAPGVVYHVSTSGGPITIETSSPVGGRIVFGLAAILVNVFLLSMFIGWVQTFFPSRSRKPPDGSASGERSGE
jgi:hypothetical protein